MKRLILIFSFFNFLITAQAQKAGDIISGTVTDAFGPVMITLSRIRFSNIFMLRFRF